MTNKTLKKYFKRFNRKYFKNALDNDVVVRFSSIRGCGVTSRQITTAKIGYGARLIVPVFRILINKTFRNSFSLTMPTLLHEMVHVEHWEYRGHGRDFNRRMLQLAKAGAFNGWW